MDTTPIPVVGPSGRGTVSSGGLLELLQSNPMQVAWRRLLKELSSLPRAIGIMVLVTVLSGVGTFIPQNKVRAGHA